MLSSFLNTNTDIALENRLEMAEYFGIEEHVAIEGARDFIESIKVRGNKVLLAIEEFVTKWVGKVKDFVTKVTKGEELPVNKKYMDAVLDAWDKLDKIDTTKYLNVVTKIKSNADKKSEEIVKITELRDKMNDMLENIKNNELAKLYRQPLLSEAFKPDTKIRSGELSKFVKGAAKEEKHLNNVTKFLERVLSSVKADDTKTLIQLTIDTAKISMEKARIQLQLITDLKKAW